MNGLLAIDWPAALAEPDGHGAARLPGLRDAEQCQAMAARYRDPDGFRSRVVTQLHRDGQLCTLGIIFHDAA